MLFFAFLVVMRACCGAGAELATDMQYRPVML